MKKLKLESFFQPEIPGPRNSHQTEQGETLHSSGNEFPYQKKESVPSEEEVLKDFGLLEFFGMTGPSMSSKDNLSRSGKLNNSQGLAPGKGSKSFANWMRQSTHSAPQELQVGSINKLNSDTEDVDSLNNLNLEMRGPREIATKELAPVSTKQPFANGMPTAQDNPYLISDVPEEDELNLESLIKEFATTDWSVDVQSKKAHPENDEITFLDKIEDLNRFLMNTEEEFNKNQKERNRS